MLCPNCPLCGHPPEFILAGAVQAFCGFDGCEVMCWNPSETLDVNLLSVESLRDAIEQEDGA